MLAQGEERWHQGVPLLATFCLCDEVRCVGIVLPHVGGRLGIKKADKGQASAGPEACCCVKWCRRRQWMVPVGCCSESAMRACTTASVPARVDRAYWCGRQAWLILLPLF